jgi:hypothetical protein
VVVNVFMDSEDIWRECSMRLAEGGVEAPSMEGRGGMAGRRTTKSGEAMVGTKTGFAGKKRNKKGLPESAGPVDC